MTKQQIALYIEDTLTSKGGLLPLVTIGLFPKGGQFIQKTELVRESVSYAIPSLLSTCGNPWVLYIFSTKESQTAMYSR